MLEVVLVRHGETDWNRWRRVQGGHSDIPLNESGRQQAAALGLRLKDTAIRAVYSSPLKRARSTARLIATPHRLKVEMQPDLVELDVGELEGVDIGSMGRHLDELLLMRGYDGTVPPAEIPLFGKVQYIGGESLDGLQQRAWDALQRIVGQHQDGAVVVVSHYFVILSIICTVLGLPVSRLGSFRLGSGSISTVVFDGGVPRLTLFGDTCHLKL